MLLATMAATIVQLRQGHGGDGALGATADGIGTAGALGAADHAALPYDAPEALAGRLAPLLAGALSSGGPTLAVLDRPERAALRAALGADTDRVEFLEPAQVHSVPAFTVAVRWARLGRRVAAPGARALVVNQYVPGLDTCGPEHWARLDIALDVAIAGLPVTVVCPCPDDPEALRRMRETHPLELTSDGPRPSPTYRPPPEALAAFPPPPPPDLGPPAAELHFGREELAALRHLVAEVATAAPLEADRVADLVLAVNELASNSVEHGPGRGRLRLWARPGWVSAEVADRGRMDVPFPGMVAPSPQGERGRGLWLASELTDVLQVWSDQDGTVIRVISGS